LHLPAVDYFLVKDAELVADAVGERRYLERRERIDEARGEPAETAVAETGLGLLREQYLEVEAEILNRVPHLVVDAEVDEVVAEMWAQQVFSRQVANGTRTLRRVR